MQSAQMNKLCDLVKHFDLRPDYDAFRTEFEAAAAVASASDLLELRAIGTSAFQSFLEGAPAQPDLGMLQWFTSQCRAGVIAETAAICQLLLRVSRVAKRELDRRRHGAFDAATNVLQTKRVVQLSWFGFAGFASSDAFEVRRSIYSSLQEREFVDAARLRFPGLAVIPNYPLRQVVDLDKLKSILPSEIITYGFGSLLDAILVTPREGDPVAAFELDSRHHDERPNQKRDRWKEELLRAAHISLFRLRSEDPTATSVDEWYSLLTDEILDDIDCGTRIRTRDVHSTLVPIVRY